MTRTAYYPGSFDPVTNGHLDIIARAAKLADRLVIAVGAHHAKSALLSANDRVSLIEACIAGLKQQTATDIRVETFDGLVVDAARAAGAAMIVRGLRDGRDFDYERQMAGMNAAMAGDVETVFLAASPETSFVASSLIRQIAAMGGDISPFVPEQVREVVARTVEAM